jgi:hypothetical protein
VREDVGARKRECIHKTENDAAILSRCDYHYYPCFLPVLLVLNSMRFRPVSRARRNNLCALDKYWGRRLIFDKSPESKESAKHINKSKLLFTLIHLTRRAPCSAQRRILSYIPIQTLEGKKEERDRMCRKKRKKTYQRREKRQACIRIKGSHMRQLCE